MHGSLGFRRKEPAAWTHCQAAVSSQYVAALGKTEPLGTYVSKNYWDFQIDGRHYQDGFHKNAQDCAKSREPNPAKDVTGAVARRQRAQRLDFFVHGAMTREKVGH